MGDKTELRRKPTVHYPAELDENGFFGPLYGYYHEESNHYNVVEYGERTKLGHEYLGELSPPGQESGDDARPAVNGDRGLGLIGTRENSGIVFRGAGRRCTEKPYERKLNIFSRNAGILETDLMLHTSVLISGVGSVGSLVALDLARSGVGRFLLVDNDVMEYHNISRHQCGIADVGRYKTEAVKERILEIHPFADVKTCVGILEDVPKEVFDGFIDEHSLVIGCNDNREGNIYANTIAATYGVPLLAIGFWERAAAGEVFYTIPRQMPCYECVFGHGRDPDGGAYPSANRRFYTTEEDLRDAVFEPGIATDINFVTNVGIKVALDLLNRGNEDYSTRVLEDLSQYTLVCNSNKKSVGGEQVEIFSYPLQVTRSLEVEYSAECRICSA